MSDINDKGFDAITVAELANAKAQGKRPEYFKDPMAENHFSITMSVVAELAVARERIDTLERVLMSKGLLDPQDVETYVPDAESAEQRQLAQIEYTSRIFRAMQQELQRVVGNEKTMDEMAKILGQSDD